MYKTALFLAVTLTLSAPALAQDETEADEEIELTTANLQMRAGQQQRLLGQLFMAPIYFFGWVTVHEGSHALMTMAVGQRVIEFRPYPHNLTWSDDEGEEQEYFVFGSMTRFIPNDEEPWREALISIAPAITDLLIFTASDLALQYVVDPHSAAAPFLLGLGMVTPLVDFIVGLNCMEEYCDHSYFAETTGIPRGAMMVIGYSLAFTAVWRCLHQFRRIFMEPRSTSEHRTSTISVSPITGPELTGISLSGSF